MPPLLHTLLLYYFHVKWTITEAVVYSFPLQTSIDDCTLNVCSPHYISLFSWSFDPLNYCSFTQLPLVQLSLCFQMWKWKEHTWTEERIKDITWDDTIFRFKSAMNKSFCWTLLYKPNLATEMKSICYAHSQLKNYYVIHCLSQSQKKFQLLIPL